MGKVIRITEDKIQRIIDMYLNGSSKVEIAKCLNISTQSVTKYLLKNNIKQKDHFLSNEIKEEICRLYTEDNMNLTTISRLLNVDFYSVVRALKKSNIQLKSKSEVYRKYSINETYFDNIDNQNKAYILGLLYADGNVSSGNKYVMQIALQEEDVHILEDIKAELESDIPLYYRERCGNNKNVYSLIINNVHMHQSLIKAGVIPQKTFSLVFPNFLQDDLVRHFIRGYFDGDGSFGFYKRNDRKNSYHNVFTITGTNMLCLSVKEILENKLRVHCSISYCHQKYDSPIRTLSVSGRYNCQKVLDWLYYDANMFLKRKKNKYLEFCNLYNLAC